MSDPFVTETEVRAIIDTELLDISAFITTAHVLVVQLFGEVVSDLNKEIERWLSAHYIAVRDPRLKQQEIGDAKEIYALSTGSDGLATTPYGQQVLALDTSGAFANLGKRKASFIVIPENYYEKD